MSESDLLVSDLPVQVSGLQVSDLPAQVLALQESDLPAPDPLILNQNHRAASPVTFQPMTGGSTQAASSTDSAVAMPPGSANVTTRLRNPGI